MTETLSFFLYNIMQIVNIAIGQSVSHHLCIEIYFSGHLIRRQRRSEGEDSHAAEGQTSSIGADREEGGSGGIRGRGGLH